MSSTSDLRASVTASLCSRIVSHPVDTLRCLAIVNSSSLSDFRPSRLYRGFSAAILMTIPGTTAYLLTYRSVLERLGGPDELWHVLVASFTAEAVGGLVFTPFEVIKQRQQAGVIRRRDLVQSIWKIRRQLYRGYGVNLISYLPFSGLFFVLYERWKVYSSNVFLGSALAACVASLATHPFNVVQTYVQVQPQSVRSAIRRAMANGAGFRGLWSGLGFRMGFCAANTGIAVSLFDYLSNPRQKQ